MFSTVRKRLTYANVVLTLALVFALTGGAFAASKYVITSTKQISPKVLKTLKGAGGAAGAAGPAGAQGPQGPQGNAGVKGETGGPGKEGKAGEPGKEGSPWTDKGTLPKGSSETGQWAFTQDEGSSAVAFGLSFPIALAKSLDEEHVHYIAAGETPPPGCGGSAEKPEASSGNMCVFTTSIIGFKTFKEVVLSFSVHDAEASAEGAGRTGAYLQAITPAEPETLLGDGDWVVTG